MPLWTLWMLSLRNMVFWVGWWGGFGYERFGSGVGIGAAGDGRNWELLTYNMRDCSYCQQCMLNSFYCSLGTRGGFWGRQQTIFGKPANLFPPDTQRISQPQLASRDKSREYETSVHLRYPWSIFVPMSIFPGWRDNECCSIKIAPKRQLAIWITIDHQVFLRSKAIAAER